MTIISVIFIIQKNLPFQIFIIQTLTIQLQIIIFLTNTINMKVQDFQIETKSTILPDFEESYFQALCKKFQFEWKNKKCPSGNPVTRICVDDQCSLSVFLCNNLSCQQCDFKHPVCYIVKESSFETLLNQMSQYQKAFFKKLYKIDQQLIMKIKNSQFEIVKMISSANLDEEYRKILVTISGREQAQRLIGKEARKLFETLRSKVKQKNQKQEQLQGLFSKRSDDMMNENIKLKTLIFQNFLKGSVPKVPDIQKPNYFIQSPLITLCINDLYTNTPDFYKNKTYNNYGYLEQSSPEKMAFQKKHIGFLKTQLGNPIRANLLFRASEHNFQANKFHQLCDTRKNTLTIIRTQYRKTIFAFAAQPWKSSSGQYIADPTGKSCIIWLDTLQKLSMTNTSYSIYCHTSYGPTFGGHEIFISNGASGTTDFPVYYNNNKGGANQQTYTMMSGNPNGNSFNILQYEVYGLIFG